MKIYLHESNRVYRDKMVDDQDFATFDKIQAETVGKFYEVKGFNSGLTKKLIVIRACVSGLARLLSSGQSVRPQTAKLIRAKACQPALLSVQQIRAKYRG